MYAFTDAKGPVAAPTQLGADFMPLSGTRPVLGAMPSKDIRAVFAHHNFACRASSDNPGSVFACSRTCC